jgi:lipopolysaccharide/colanic/teichoic acid biosynthesis glycosyltransferase
VTHGTGDAPAAHRQGPYARWGKPLLDRVAAAALLLVLSPLLLLSAAAVLVDSGRPLFFLQPRLGRFGRPFGIIKFRTMRPGAPAALLPDGSTLVTAGDPRVTRVGRVLRATSLDELPQLVNVLRGEMSLVGPRPDLVEQERLYDDEVRPKLEVLPGITGLAQVSGRNGLPWRERLRLDARYARGVSFGGDVRILLRTVVVVARPSGIHPAAGAAGPER